MSKKNRRVTHPIPKHDFSNNMLLDIVIPVLNRFDLLGQCLDSIPLAAGDIKYNIIVVDNGSEEPQARQFYDKYMGKIVLVHNRVNVGYPMACNIGAKRKASPVLFFLNSDVILEPNSIQEAYNSLMLGNNFGIVGMKLLFPSEEQLEKAEINPRIRPAGKVQHVGMFTNLHGMFLHMYVGWDADHPKVMQVRDAYAVTGAALMIKRAIWNNAGGYYEGYGMGNWEDVDLCLTVREMGYNIIVEQKAVAIHYVGATSEQAKMQFPFEMNRFMFLQRWANRLKYTEAQAW